VDDGRKLFGIGLSRTGTSSLNDALVVLGLPSAHYPSDPATRAAVAAHLAGGGRVELRLPVLDDHVGLTDTPVCCVYGALDRAYPGSKFVLTVRDEDAWLRSCERYWRRGRAGRRRRTGIRVSARRVARLARGDSTPDFTEYVHLVNRHLYGSTDFDTARHMAALRRYEAEVEDYFRGRDGDLLRLDICGGEGWPELCAFLDLPEPQVPFPWANVLAPGALAPGAAA